MRVAILDIRLPAKEIHTPRGSEIFLRRTRNNPINQGSPAGAITSHGCETRREPNPSRKYCPPRRRNIFSGVCFFFSPRLFFSLVSRPRAQSGILVYPAPHGVVDDVCPPPPFTRSASHPLPSPQSRVSFRFAGFFLRSAVSCGA